MNTPNRRRFLQFSAVVIAAPFAARLAIPTAQARVLPRLPLDHPQGKALAYIEVATESKHPAFKPGTNCLNCKLYTPADEGCTLFPGFSVEPKGWCAAWIKIP